MRRTQRGWTGGNLFHFDFAACDAYAGAEAAAAALKCPATLILGGSDQMTMPKAAEPLIRLLAPKVVRLRSGHNLMAEVPDGVLDAMLADLRAG